MILPRKKLNAGLMWIIFLVGLSCNSFFSNTEETELRTAYEKYEEISTNSALTLDFSQLPDVLTDEALEATIEHLETRRNYSVAFADETEIIDFDVLENNEHQATIRVKEYYREFYLEPTTEERIYQAEEHRYWRIIQYEMRKENGKWKVANFEFIDWSG